MDLKEKYFDLAAPQRTLVLLAILAVFASAIGGLLLPRKITAYKAAEKNFKVAEKAANAIKIKKEQLRKVIKTHPELGPQDLDNLRVNGNEIPPASNVSEFLDALKEINERLGGRKFTIEEGPIASAYTTFGPGRNVYKVMRLPVKIIFESDYSVLSNYLFQLYGLKRFMDFENIDVRNKGLTGDIRITVDTGIYFLEES